MRKYVISVIIGSVIIGIFGCGGNGGAGTVYRFTFQPPDSIGYQVEFSKMRVSTDGDSSVTDSSWSRSRHTLVKTPNVYRLTRQTDTMEQFINGEQARDPILEVFAVNPIRLMIDSTGTVVDVTGYEEIFEQLDQMLGPDTAAMLRQVVTPSQLEMQEIQTWNQHFAPLVGLELALNGYAVDTTFPNLPVEGRVDQYELSELVDTVRIDGKLCGRLVVSASTDPGALAEMTDHTVDEIAEYFGLDEAQITSAANRMSVNSTQREWLMEFETMLIHAENQEFRLHMDELGDSGEMTRREIRETQVKTYTY